MGFTLVLQSSYHGFSAQSQWFVVPPYLLPGEAASDYLKNQWSERRWISTQPAEAPYIAEHGDQVAKRDEPLEPENGVIDGAVREAGPKVVAGP